MEFVEESFINKRIPIKVTQTNKGDTTTLRSSTSVYLPGLNDNNKLLRGEYLEAEIKNDNDSPFSTMKDIEFDLSNVLRTDLHLLNSKCVQVYLEVSVVPLERIKEDNDKCNNDHSEPKADQVFGGEDVLKVKPGFDYSTVADSNTFTFNNKAKAYKESDGVFFHQKDIELVENHVQNLELVLLQNFETADHLLGMVLETPFGGNHDNFLHGEDKPDCIKNECIYSDKAFDAQTISYVFNSNSIDRIRIWFYRMTDSKSSSSCTPFHLSIKSQRNYLDTHPKEKVACLDEVFPPKITVRKYAHKEVEGTYIVNDNFRVDSFLPGVEGDVETSSVIINQDSLLKIIISKEVQVHSYELSILKVNGDDQSLVYSYKDSLTRKEQVSSTDIRASILLQEGHYLLKIKALLKRGRSSFKTCDNVKIYVGITPTEQITSHSYSGTESKIPSLDSIMKKNAPIRVKLPEQESIQARGTKGFVSTTNNIYESTIEYDGNTGDIGLYVEIDQNINPNVIPEINEITATLYPDLEIHLENTGSKAAKLSNTDIPIISTSIGKSYMHVQKLEPNKVYTVEVLQQAILSAVSSLDKTIDNVFDINAYLYSATKDSDIKKASVKINGNKVSLPVKPWVPACEETTLSQEILDNAIQEVFTTGVQYEEILALNEEVKRIRTSTFDLNNMKDPEATLLISVSPYNSKNENILDEFMITSVSRGADKTTVRSQEFEGGNHLVHVELSKLNKKAFALRMNYAVTKSDDADQGDQIESQCNMVRLSIQYIPKTKQSPDSKCTATIYDSSIKSIIPQLLPDSSLSHESDKIIAYEYTTTNSQDFKYKLDPTKPSQNKLKFILKKASTFRFEMNAYPCVSAPIGRTVVLNSVTKTHDKIMTENVAVGIPTLGNSIVLYANELLPGNYELEIQYGWLQDMDSSSFKTLEELVDFQIEIYSLHQDPISQYVLHDKDRHLREINTVVRDLSVVAFMERQMGQYLGQDIPIPSHPIDKGAPLGIPFKISHENAQVLITTEKKFTYLESIQILRKDSNALIKRIQGGDDNLISEILQQGEYILHFNYKDDSERDHNLATQFFTFGISDYENVKKYKSCHQQLFNKCENTKLGETVIMLEGNNGEVILDLEVDEPELFNVQLHYNQFLTQRPITVYFDKVKADNEMMKHKILPKGNHTLTIKGPEKSLDETCILLSMIEYETALSNTEVTTLEGVDLRPGVQSIVIEKIEKGTTSIPLPSFKEYKNDTLLVSTLILHFDDVSNSRKTSNLITLDLNFDTKQEFDFQPQLYYESSKDKIISYFDIMEKQGADISKQFEIVHQQDYPLGKYLAHFVVDDGDTIATKFDQCNAAKKVNIVQTLDQGAQFYYNEFGKEDFSLAITKDLIDKSSKFFDPESNLFYIEVVYQTSKPSFVEFAVEFDISIQNVDLFVFKDFDESTPLEDQELASSKLEIPSVIDSTVSREVSIYLPEPGKYSVFIVDKKFYSTVNQIKEFEDVEPCTVMKVSHSIQPYSPEKISADSISFLSMWPRRLELGEPFFVSAKRNLEVTIYPNTPKLNPKKPPKISFSVIDLESNKKLYSMEPDQVSVLAPTRAVGRKNNLSKYEKDIQIKCLFKAETLKNVIGSGKVLTYADQDQLSDKSMIPYYVIVDGKEENLEKVDTSKLKDTDKKSSQETAVEEKLSLTQQRQERTKNQITIERCQKNCQNGDCNKRGICVCRRGFYGENCENKHHVGKLDQIKQKAMKKTEQAKKPKVVEDDDEFDYDDDDEDMLDQIQTVATSRPTNRFGNSRSTFDDSAKTKRYEYGWFDFLLLILLLLGISLIFYQNLWSGRFCRKKLAKKFKREDDIEEREDRAIIKEELDNIDEGVEMIKSRKAHAD